ADVPDQVRVLTLYGKLHTGFRDAQGNEFAPTVVDDAPADPTAELAGPRAGDSISTQDLNGRGYVDVTFTPPAGSRLEAASITDFDPELKVNTVTGGTLAFDDTQAPVLVNATTNTYRY